MMKTNLVFLKRNHKISSRLPSTSHKRFYSKDSSQIIFPFKEDADENELRELRVKNKKSISNIIAKNARGTGGRSSISGVVATVFGASGFLGKYVVNELGKVGSQVVVAYRGEENAQRHLKILGDLGQIIPLQCDVNDPHSIEEVISRSNVVVNLIGKRWGTNNFSLNTVNNIIPENIAKVAQKVGVEKLVHVSALGASPDSPSEFLRTKYAGEVSVRNAFPDAVIVRPAGVFGHEDRILQKWASIGARWPFIPILRGYENRKEGYICQTDFSKALYRIIVSDNNGETFELGGVEVTTEELIQAVLECIWYKEKKLVPIPLDLALKVTKWTQYLRRSRFTRDEVLALTTDAVVNPGSKSFSDLEITPQSILDLLPRYIKHFRNPVTMMDTMYETK